MRLRRFIFGAAALALVTGTVLAAGAASASASVRNIPTLTATGSVSCGNIGTGVTGISGTITFSPPLVNGGTAPETTTISIKLKKCTTTGSNVPTSATKILKGKDSQIISSTGSMDDCAGLATSTPQVLTVKWKYKNASGVKIANVNPTTIVFPGYTTNASASPWAAGDAGFQLPGSPSTGTPVNSGTSFAGSDSGASSDSVAYLNVTEAQFLAACGTPGGFASASFTQGASFAG